MKIKWHNENKLHMQVKENNGVTYLTYPSFEQFPDIVHCFSTRLGGVSQGIFSSMNLSFTRGDEENAVKDNYRRLSAAVGFSLEDIVTSDQTHTTNVQLVGAEDRGKGVTRPRTYKDVDGMITNVPGVVLCTFYADCVPLYFVDPVHKAVGLSHSGWRGTVGKIGKMCIRDRAGVLLLFILIMSLTLFQAQKSYDESIQERDEKLALQAEYTADLLAKQNTIEEQEGTIKTKDEKLTALAQTLAEQEAKLKEQQALLNQQQMDLDEKTTQLSEQQTKIDNIIRCV